MNVIRTTWVFDIELAAVTPARLNELVKVARSFPGYMGRRTLNAVVRLKYDNENGRDAAFEAVYGDEAA